MIELVFQDMYHMGRMVRMDICLIAAGTTWAPPSSSGHLQWRGDDGYYHLAIYIYAVIIHLHEAW